LAGLLVLGVFLVGVAGYMLIERLSFLDAMYTTIAMMTTEGTEVQPLSNTARVFTIMLMVLGVGSVLYTFVVFMEYVLEGHLNLAIRRRFMENKIAALRGHSVVCGFGRVGSQIAEDLAAAGAHFVVIDEKESSIQRCREKGYLLVEGDATSDEILAQAGIPHARALLVATDDDSHNISITLSARHLSSALFIVSRANHDETVVKLRLAGANRIISPYTIGGHKMASVALDPQAVEPA
jgi:voltage-gated potassium channel